MTHNHILLQEGVNLMCCPIYAFKSITTISVKCSIDASKLIIWKSKGTVARISEVSFGAELQLKTALGAQRWTGELNWELKSELGNWTGSLPGSDRFVNSTMCAVGLQYHMYAASAHNVELKQARSQQSNSINAQKFTFEQQRVSASRSTKIAGKSWIHLKLCLLDLAIILLFPRPFLPLPNPQLHVFCDVSVCPLLWVDDSI